MTNQIKQLTAAIAEFEAEIKTLNQQKSQLSMKQSAPETGITPSGIAKAARQSSVEAQQRRIELESVSAAIAALTKHLGQKQSELHQAQQQERREALSSEVESARVELEKSAERANKLAGQLKEQLTFLKALANESQPAYSELQREFSNVGNKPENLLEVEFTGLPVVVERGKNFAIEGEKINLLWQEEAAKAQRQAEMQARRINQKSQFEVAKQRRELEGLVKFQAALESQRSAKEIELEGFRRKLREARDSGYSNTSGIEAAIAGAHQEALNLGKEIHELKTKITDLEAQNDAA